MVGPKSKKTVWITGVVVLIAVVAAACVAVLALRLPGRGGDTAAAAASPTSQSAVDERTTPSTTDPMEVIENYETFMMQYADYAEMLNSQDGIPADQAAGYAEWLARFDDVIAQFEAVQDVELTPEQERYFDEVIDRVDDRMVEATGSELVRTPRSAQEAEEQARLRQEEAARTSGASVDESVDASAGE